MTHSTSPQEPTLWNAAQSAVAQFHYHDLRLFLEQLEWSLQQEAALIRQYNRLLRLAPDEACFELMRELLADDRKHYLLLEELYRELRGSESKLKTESRMEMEESYEFGVRAAIAMALEAAKRYRDTYLLTPSPKVRDIFFLGMTDEMNHITRLWLTLRS